MQQPKHQYRIDTRNERQTRRKNKTVANQQIPGSEDQIE